MAFRLLENLVQTDAAINPGNSGAPSRSRRKGCVNKYGNNSLCPRNRICNSNKYSQKCSTEIIQNGIKKRPWIGIVGLTITPELSRYHNLPIERGVLVTKVVKGSPAEVAEMTVGDIILRVNGTVIYRIEDLLREIHKRKVGEKIMVVALRAKCGKLSSWF